MERHTKRDLEAGGPGQGTLKTRKRTRRAEDGSIIVRPSQRQLRIAAGTVPSPVSANNSSQSQRSGDEDFYHEEAPLSPPGSGSDPTSVSLEDTDPFLTPLMPPGPFEPYVDPIPGQFDAADGSYNVELDGIGDYFGMDTGKEFLEYWKFQANCTSDRFQSPFRRDLKLQLAFRCILSR
jgi:hypothetical protein